MKRQQTLAKREKPQPIGPPEMILYTDSKQRVSYKLGEKDQAVAALFKATDKSKPIFIYIHGRALGIRNGYDQEPEESMKCCMLELFTRYGASNVLMFHWPHWGKGIDYNGSVSPPKILSLLGQHWQNY